MTDHIHKQTRGWLLPYLLGLDPMFTGRWMYWLEICETLKLPDEPIPQVHFMNSPADVSHWPPILAGDAKDAKRLLSIANRLDEQPEKHIQRILRRQVEKAGRWYDDAWLDFSHWLLHGFGVRGMDKLVDAISEDVRNFWYTDFNLAYLMAVPTDWPAYILQCGPRWMGNGKAKWSQSTAFFSTPMNICYMMAMMTFTGGDERSQTVCDPCVGTGSMLLQASNHSLRLYGQDIVQELVWQTMLNGYLWMPWMVFSPPGIDEMFQEITGIPVPSWPTTELVTEPEAVAVLQAHRQAQYEQAHFSFD